MWTTIPAQAASDANSADLLNFSPMGATRVQAVFDEPELSSDGGTLLIREAAELNGVIDMMVSRILDERSRQHVKHSIKELLSQRVTQICHGYEDTNDCDTLNKDTAFKMAVGRHPDAEDLASQPTMTRLENSIGRRDLLRLFNGFVEHFLDSYEKAPEIICIDMDPTPNRIYGAQQLGLFNSHYDEHCLMPFHVYDGITGRLIATVVRPGKTPAKEEILGLLRRIVRPIRKRFPKTTIVFRADSHHAKPEVIDWLEDNDVRYVIGLSTNNILKKNMADIVEKAAAIQKRDWTTFRRFHSFHYAAGTWRHERRVIARVEATTWGVDTRFVVTDLSAGAKYLYETVYCGRARAELMIKEHKCFLKSSRTSCHTAEANQFRLFVHSAAYVVMHGLRETVLRGTELASATFDSIRLRLLKTAARVEAGKTFVRFHMPASSPAAAVFVKTAAVSRAARGT